MIDAKDTEQKSQVQLQCEYQLPLSELLREAWLCNLQRSVHIGGIGWEISVEQGPIPGTGQSQAQIQAG